MVPPPERGGGAAAAGGVAGGQPGGSGARPGGGAARSRGPRSSNFSRVSSGQMPLGVGVGGLPDGGALGGGPGRPVGMDEAAAEALMGLTGMASAAGSLQTSASQHGEMGLMHSTEVRL